MMHASQSGVAQIILMLSGNCQRLPWTSHYLDSEGRTQIMNPGLIDCSIVSHDARQLT